MSSAVLISIQPKWVELIAAGLKTIEVRKSVPRLQAPFKVYIYETKTPWIWTEGLLPGTEWGCMVRRLERARGNVVGGFMCDMVSCTHPPLANLGKTITDTACLTADQLEKYSTGKELFFWHISDLTIYDEPRPLTNFSRPCPNGLYCEGCAMYQRRAHACGNSALQIKRPPQDWMYAEDQT